MSKKVHISLFFVLGVITGLLIYQLISVSVFSRADGRAGAGWRAIASYYSTDISSGLRYNCNNNLQNITSVKDIDVYCSFTTQKSDHGVRYEVRSTVEVKTDSNDEDKAVISIKNRLKKGEEHITEADYCTDCTEQITVDLSELTDENLSELSKKLSNKISSALSRENDRIEGAVEEAYDHYTEKQKLERKIANCEISKKSTVHYTREISAEEKMECRRDQLANMDNNEDRTRFFHSRVKKDLWYLASQEDPLDNSFFLTDYMRDLSSPDFFSHDSFSVRAAMDTVQKYNDLRLFTQSLGDNKLSALNAVSAQLPFYFYTNAETAEGRRDRRFLETAWNTNFTERPFPSYYSLSLNPNNTANSRPRPAQATGTSGLSAQQFRNIVNSEEFQKLYR